MVNTDYKSFRKKLEGSISSIPEPNIRMAENFVSTFESSLGKPKMSDLRKYDAAIDFLSDKGGCSDRDIANVFYDLGI
ncbi:MAG: hypothetical protein AABW73_04880 [Nanoarchaeota archaeon]